MLRVLRFLPFLFILPAAAVPLGAEGNLMSPQMAGPAMSEAQETAQALDRLFRQLRFSESTEEASKTEADIYIRLTTSASPTTNLLLENANAALENDDIASARAMLADVVKLDPRFAEGLTRAASLAYQAGDLDEAEGLLRRALRIEPRHFGAWAGLGMVLEDEGDLKGAQAAYREALYLHPFLDPAKRGLIRLDAKLDGLSL
jgi:Flp pilus assembly protein TadD